MGRSWIVTKKLDVVFLMQAPSQPPETREQAELRYYLTRILMQHDEVQLIRTCHDLIALMRDQLSTQLAQVRRQAALVARETMTVKELAKASGQSVETIGRLVTEARARGVG
jgi:ERCC4-related helicase